MYKPELLAPAGDLEKLKIAINYGADAVYISGKRFGLRAGAGNFSIDDFKEGVEFAHERGVKLYVTLNMIPHNNDLAGLDEYIRELHNLKVDALIIADPGILMMVRSALPDMPVHLSTQANNTNWMSARFWYDQGVKRIILARELSLEEIQGIRANIPEGLQLECFVHGAMCMSYSGRCLISNYMAHRDSNRGDCAHPCRWKYYLMEEKRQGEYIPVFEDDRGTYIFNSKDLCMIKYIPQLVEAGIESFKIEGRMKSIYYVATVVNAYRQAIDEYFNNPEEYSQKETMFLDEITKVSHRELSTGFYFGKPSNGLQIYESASYIRKYDFLGLILYYDAEKKEAVVEQRNRIFVGDEVEIMSPGKPFHKQTIDYMKDEEGVFIDVAPHPQQIIRIPVGESVKPFDIIRGEIIKD